MSREPAEVECHHSPTWLHAGAGCKLNDVWQLSLEGNLWQQLSQPYFTSKRCERLFG